MNDVRIKQNFRLCTHPHPHPPPPKKEKNNNTTTTYGGWGGEEKKKGETFQHLKQ